MFAAITLHCAMVMRNTKAMQQARSHGAPRVEAVHSAPNPHIAEILAWYIYDMNPKRRTPPAKERELIERACMSTEQNALSEQR